VFAAITAEHGLVVTRAERVFGAKPADSDEAARLSVPVGSALLEPRGFNLRNLTTSHQLGVGARVCFAT